MFIYVVTMYRANTLETHTYVYGVFTSYAEAMSAKTFEEERMCDRYVGYIDECLLDVHPPEGVADRLYESSLDRDGFNVDVTLHQ